MPVKGADHQTDTSLVDSGATSQGRRSRLAALKRSFRLGSDRRAVEAGDRRPDERLHTIVAGARGIIYISELGPQGRWTYVSPQVEEILGFSPSEWMSDAGLWERQLHPDDRARVLAEEEADVVSYGPGQVFESEYRVLTRSGESRWLRDTASIVETEDSRLVWSGVLTDITERRAIEEELRSSEERYRSVIETASDAFVSLTDDGTIVEWNRAAEEMFGWAGAEAVGLPLVDTIVPERDRAAHERGLARYLLTDPGIVVGNTLDVTARRRDGTEFPVELSIWATVSQGVRRTNAFVRDTSERKALEAVTHQAFHDPLTDLANRALFTDRVAAALARRDEESTATVAVLLLDLDDFKTVNDSLGHAAGDELLIAVAARLRSCVRPGDTLARLAGDEFAILLDELDDPAAAVAVAKRVGKRLEAPFEIDAMEIAVRASIGISLGQTPDARPEDLMRDADVAMYAAKARGKGGFEVFEPHMRQAVVKRMELKGDLRHALERGELQVHYQPYVKLDDESIVGAEALLRWVHAERGEIPPLDFIPLAEEMGLIVPIGRWVLGEACAQAVEWGRRWPRLGPLTVSVNVSARQLVDRPFVGDVAGIVSAHGLAAGQLVLELTESSLVEDPDQAVQRLLELRELGIRLAIDDFGTGYSSLGYLQRYPIEILKVHRAFVAELGRDPEQPALAKAILQLAHHLGMKTIAEGVEEAAQVASLRALGCGFAQGFYFARPLPAAEFAALLDERATRRRHLRAAG
ncbi:sensor domain-containing protein [Gaiella sp.]|uniref:sensor domain-containing protein n=1 Tax=Gaiella sp. TaxID=2663207 RepID=UPI002E2F8CB8|nr:EAL domain-containing protein [Gaiella sp.]HEX5583768.1 EAL domain-containing protein [Gaiella sp.]